MAALEADEADERAAAGRGGLLATEASGLSAVGEDDEVGALEAPEAEEEDGGGGLEAAGAESAELSGLVGGGVGAASAADEDLAAAAAAFNEGEPVSEAWEDQ